jgi:predicted permease
MVTPDFFQTLGIRIAKGRGFTEQDGATGAPVAVVNDTFVDKYLFNSDPLAQRLVVDEPIPGPSRIGPAIERQIVGVYHNVHNNGVRQENFPEINVPFWQSPWPNATISVRTTGDPASMTNSITAVVQSIDTNLPLDQVRTMDQIVDESLAGERFAAILFATFASIALILAAIGIYGVMSFAVAQQTHEIGLRMALGARPGQVLLLVLQEGMLLALMGLILGLGGAYFVERALSSALYEVVAADSAVVAAVSILLFLFAVLACYLPARRATRVNPIDSLRYE